MQKKEHDHFIGMWRHPQGGWEIRYQQAGKKKSEYSKEEQAAKLRADYWKATLGQAPEETEYEHPVLYWEKQARQAAKLAMDNPHDRDISATCRAVASLIQAAMRTCKYIPAPQMQVAPDSAPITGDVSNMTTAELEELLNVHDKPKA